jgi:hypothetical protein
MSMEEAKEEKRRERTQKAHMKHVEEAQRRLALQRQSMEMQRTTNGSTGGVGSASGYAAST